MATARVESLLCRNHHVIHEEVRWLVLVVVGSLEEEHHLFASVGVEGASNIDGFQHPVVGHVGIAVLLQGANGCAVGCSQGTVKEILAAARRLIGI